MLSNHLLTINGKEPFFYVFGGQDRLNILRSDTGISMDNSSIPTCRGRGALVEVSGSVSMRIIARRGVKFERNGN